ncbi:hypothetical protein [Paenibacillus sp. A3M_27_13]|uniref:hypothetical protein n=1 Tax=unclassified Paenibacillus TaxID=185978 RepID=UPI0020B670D2|nr:hypothetical protein [Paenibacillus sp. A3M_27_13]MCP3745218.1 hypothetical protein [Paenibacillus sp. A3M_27_13]
MQKSPTHRRSSKREASPTILPTPYEKIVTLRRLQRSGEFESGEAKRSPLPWDFYLVMS